MHFRFFIDLIFLRCIILQLCEQALHLFYNNIPHIAGEQEVCFKPNVSNQKIFDYSPLNIWCIESSGVGWHRYQILWQYLSNHRPRRFEFYCCCYCSSWKSINFVKSLKTLIYKVLSPFCRLLVAIAITAHNSNVFCARVCNKCSHASEINK